jgi:hypothetical protein
MLRILKYVQKFGRKTLKGRDHVGEGVWGSNTKLDLKEMRNGDLK